MGTVVLTFIMASLAVVSLVAFTQISGSVQQLIEHDSVCERYARQLGGVAAASVTEAMQSISAVVEENTAATEQMSAQVEELTAQAAELAETPTTSRR